MDAVDTQAPSAIVHIESDEPVRLEQRSGARRWEVICESPCDVPIAIGREVRINGQGVRTSRPFVLRAMPGERVVLDVRTTSSAAFVGGIVTTSIGGAVALAGLMVMLFATHPLAESRGVSDEKAMQVGEGLAVAGGLGVAGGLALMLSNPHTLVEWSRVPAQRELPPPPSAMSFTLLRGTF